VRLAVDLEYCSNSVPSQNQFRFYKNNALLATYTAYYPTTPRTQTHDIAATQGDVIDVWGFSAWDAVTQGSLHCQPSNFTVMTNRQIADVGIAFNL